MEYTTEDIKNMQDPYKALIEPEDSELAKFADELNQLNLEEKIAVATRMVHSCPKDHMNSFGLQIEALRIPQNDKDSFHAVAREVLTVKRLINSLADSKNKKPYDRILNNEFSVDLFKKYPDLIQMQLQLHGKAAAERLALTTPFESHQKIQEKLTPIFSGSVFISHLEEALNFKTKIHALLLSDNPSQFFSEDQFSVDECLKFDKLLLQIIKNKESAIASALVSSNHDLNNQIFRSLELITPKSQDQSSSWRKIHEFMAESLSKIEIVKEVTHSTLSGSSHTIFGTANSQITPPESNDTCCTRMQSCSIL